MSYSSIGKRIVAAIIDNFMINIVLSVTVPFWGYFALLGMSGVVTAAYTILLQGSSWHATVGQKIFNMAVVDGNGNGISYGTAALRWLGSLLSSFILGIGYIMALFSNESQTLHDRLAGCYVVDAAFAGAAPGAGRIIGVSGEKAGMAFPVSGNGVMIGRDPAACQIVMTRSSGVSKLHCLVSYNPSSCMFIVTDRNSSYGTFSENGTRITPYKSLALRSGERFYLGSRSNMFEVK